MKKKKTRNGTRRKGKFERLRRKSNSRSRKAQAEGFKVTAHIQININFRALLKERRQGNALRLTNLRNIRPQGQENHHEKDTAGLLNRVR